MADKKFKVTVGVSGTEDLFCVLEQLRDYVGLDEVEVTQQ